MPMIKTITPAGTLSNKPIPASIAISQMPSHPGGRKMLTTAIIAKVTIRGAAAMIGPRIISVMALLFCMIDFRYETMQIPA